MHTLTRTIASAAVVVSLTASGFLGADGLSERLIGNRSRVPGSNPWVVPDQAALEQILAGVTA